MNPSRLGPVLALALGAVTLSACAPVTVRSFSAHDFKVAPFRTYVWAYDLARPTGDPRLDSNPFFEARIMTQADRQLTARGFEKISIGTPDLLLHYHASIGQKLDVSAADQKYVYCEDCMSATMYDAGTIMLDFVDARTNTVVWRGWAEGNMDGVVDNQEWLEQRIDDAIARIVATIPHRL